MGGAELAKIKLTCFRKDVYEPSDDSFLLADTLLSLSQSWAAGWPRLAVEVGSGSGYVITSLAIILQQRSPATHHHLLATDLNPSAAAATVATLQSHGVAHRVDVLLTDLVAGLLPRQGTVDLLLFNPPYVPTPDEEVERGGIAAAWAGGYRGRRVLDRLLPALPQLLSPTGHVLIVAVPDNDPAELLEVMAGMGFEGKVAAQRAADEELLQVLHFWRKKAWDGRSGGNMSFVPSPSL